MAGRIFDESKVHRDDDGKFASKAGGGGGSSLLAGLDFPGESVPEPVQDSPSRHSTGRGMPSIVNGSDITVRGGKDIALDRHSDGSYTLSTNGATVEIPPDGVSNFKSALGYVAHEGADVGDQGWVSRRNKDGRNANFALISKDAEGKYSLRVAEGDRPSSDAVRNAPPVELNDRDVDRLKGSFERLDTASRVDTGYGDVDALLTDDKKFTLRHLGDDGRPVEVGLNAKSFARLQHAFDVLIEGFDEDDPDGPDEGVTQVDINTNVGKVRVQLDGTWEGSGPDDKLRIGPVSGDAWGIIVTGSNTEAFTDALNKLAEVGENQGFYDRYNY